MSDNDIIVAVRCGTPEEAAEVRNAYVRFIKVDAIYLGNQLHQWPMFGMYNRDTKEWEGLVYEDEARRDYANVAWISFKSWKSIQAYSSLGAPGTSAPPSDPTTGQSADPQAQFESQRRWCTCPSMHGTCTCGASSHNDELRRRLLGQYWV